MTFPIVFRNRLELHEIPFEVHHVEVQIITLKCSISIFQKQNSQIKSKLTLKLYSQDILSQFFWSLYGHENSKSSDTFTRCYIIISVSQWKVMVLHLHKKNSIPIFTNNFNPGILTKGCLKELQIKINILEVNIISRLRTYNKSTYEFHNLFRNEEEKTLTGVKNTFILVFGAITETLQAICYLKTDCPWDILISGRNIQIYTNSNIYIFKYFPLSNIYLYHNFF